VAGEPPYDVLITRGHVIDGTGTPARRADVAVRNGRIVRVTARIMGSARDTINATGLIVAPGFIDPHAHISAIAEQPDAEK
jgi:N-acyl-D-amino-acid deacylase